MFVSIAAALFVTLGGMTETWAGISQYELVVSGAQPDAPGPLGPRVLRQRHVSLNLSAPDQALADSSRTMQITFFDNASYLIDIQRTEATHSGGVAYAGRVRDLPFSPAVIVNNNGVVSVMLSTPDKRFSITGSSGIGFVAQEIVANDPDDHPTNAVDVTNPPYRTHQIQGLPAADPAPGNALMARDTGSSIDVMVIYTAAARSANGGTAQMNANVDAQITLTNTIYANSLVTQRLRLVYKGETSYTESTLSAGLNHATFTNDGFMDDVPVLRDLYKADLVSVWGNFSDACGVGWLMQNENTSFAANGYNTVTSPLCTGVGSYTFAHELGHNMGLNHDIQPDPGTTTTVTQAGTGTSALIAYSRGYVDTTNRFRTVMAYADACTNLSINCLRIPYFSNPAITYNNQSFYAPASPTAPTGVANNDSLTAAQQVANVAHEQRALDDTRETVANFKQPELVSLTGPGTLTFMTAAATTPEAGPSVTVEVHRHIGSTGAVSVQYTTVNGTATAGSDYSATSGTLNWANGDTTAKSIVVPIIQDGALEGDETFTITLSSPGGGASLGTLSSIPVRILDDEPDTFPVGNSIPAGYVTPGASSAAWQVDLTEGYLSPTSLYGSVLGTDTNQVSYMNSDLVYTGTFAAGNVTFAWKVSAFTTFGHFDFLVDGVTQVTGTPPNTSTSDTAWATASVPISAGNHTLTWRFRNRLNFSCANIGGIPLPNCKNRAWVDSITLPLPPVATTTSLGTSQNPSTVGQSVTFTATVSASSGTPTGTINFRDGGISIGGCSAVAMVSSSAQCTTSALPQGARSISAVYSGSGAHSTSTSSTLTQTVNVAAGGAKRTDLNGDGRGDLIYVQPATGAFVGMLMNGLTVQDGQFLIGGGTPWQIVTTGDLNGDGKADLIWRNTDGSHVAWFMNGLTQVSAGYLIGANTGFEVAHAGDLNGDGKADLIWYQPSTGAYVGWLMDGLTILSADYLIGGGSPWRITLVGDLNGDGKADLVFKNSADQSHVAWFMNGLTQVSAGYLIGGNSGFEAVNIGDMNGDGKADLIWRQTANNAYVGWIMDGLNILSADYLIGGNTGYSIVNMTDLNGDGKMDIIFRYTDGSHVAWFMNGLVQSSAGYLLGANTGFDVLK
jgi:hypothetical protein